jgi:tRNA (cmo5U34)-methyltransferase
MSLLQSVNGLPVHYPRDATNFTFDAEVSEIFPDMARRSIPLFYETHDLHASIVGKWMEQEEVHILDVGASRGAFLSALSQHYDMERPGVKVLACDISLDMCLHLQRDFPWAQVRQLDVSDPDHEVREHAWDIINCTYVIQFVKPELQTAVLRRLARALKPGGVLFLGQKMSSPGPAGRLLHEQYIQFRLANGYTAEEINAKTLALKGAMSLFPDNVLRNYLNNYGLEVMETSRWTVFNNYMCTKGL